MVNFNFTASDLSTAIYALQELSEYLMYSEDSTRERKAFAIRYQNLASVLANHTSNLTGDDLRHVCIALKFVLEDEPLNWSASRLLGRLAPVCGFVDVP